MLGWELTDPGEELGGCTPACPGGEVVAGRMRDSGDPGSPDTWSTYLATGDVEATVARAVEAGAAVLAPAMPLGRLGPTVVVVDPVDPVVGLWQGDEHRGSTRHGEPGSVVWSEGHSKSVGASRDLCATVFGWRHEVRWSTGRPC